MATARDIVTRALRNLRVLAPGDDPTSDELTDGLSALNDMLAAWPNEEGIHIPHVELTADDTLDVPDDHIQVIRLSLAEAIGDDYGASLTPAQALRAANGRQTLRSLYFSIPDLSFDRSLVRRTDSVEDLF